MLRVSLQIVAKFSSGLGRELVHIKLSEEEQIQRMIKSVMPEHYAKFLTSLEVRSANGREETMNDDVEKVTGRPPQKFDALVQENKAVWQ